MNLKHRILLAAAVLASCSWTASAAESWTAEQVEQHTYIQGLLDDEIKIVNNRCGSKIAMSLDWTSLKGVDTSNMNLKDLASTGPVNAMRDACSASDANKAAVAKIKKVVCVYSKSGKSASFSQGVLTYKFDASADGGKDAVSPAIKSIH